MSDLNEVRIPEWMDCRHPEIIRREQMLKLAREYEGDDFICLDWQDDKEK